MRTRNVETMTDDELVNVLWGSACPIARAVALEELKRRGK